jgi:diguanylate cyclase (GGDEF)-like protein
MKTSFEAVANRHRGNWENYVKELTSQISESLITTKDFSFILSKVIGHPKSAIKALEFDITLTEFSQKFFEYKVVSENGKPTISEQIDLDTHGWYVCNLSLWINTSISPAPKREPIKSLINNLVLAYWKPDLRDDKTRIISEQNPDTKDIISNTVSNYLPDYKYVSYFFSDLDKFKEINTNYGQIQGDSAILQMALLFAKFTLEKPAAVIHRSGDEFIFLFFSNDVESALQFAFELQTDLKSAEFILLKSDGTQDKVHKEITIGIKFQSSVDIEIASYENEIGLAEKSMKNEHGNKNYAIANVINSTESDSECAILNEVSANLSKIIIKTSSHQKAFSNIWLNLVTSFTCKLLKEDLPLNGIYDLINWINFIKTPVCQSSESYTDKPDYSKSLSSFDVLIAVVRGILMHDLTLAKNNVYKISKSEDSLIIFEGESNELVKLPSIESIELNVGSTFTGKFAPIALLIKIGHDKLNIPESIFTDKIIVDDRPSKGGGLPDFWEVTISRLVSVLNINTNIKKIYLLGDSQYAANTVEWLIKLSADKPIEDREFEDVVYKINTTNIALKAATTRLKDNVLQFTTEDQIIESYANLITSGIEIETVGEQNQNLKPKAFLQKELKLDNNALTNEDGFRVETLSEAFPLMLEIARKSSINKQIIDQAGAKLGELIDFKVELSNPSKNSIPFYYRNDEAKFDEYFKTQFIEDKGLFADRLKDQLEIVVNHVVEVISNPNLQYATRRAILIIPNHYTEKEFAPFGLVSIRMIPRMEHPNNVKISFSFTWRTVEALIGFPYSFYGSIKYSEYLTAMIKSKLTNPNIDLNLDRISYIAHSLHIFMDDYGQSIAKRISDDASI